MKAQELFRLTIDEYGITNKIDVNILFDCCRYCYNKYYKVKYIPENDKNNKVLQIRDMIITNFSYLEQYNESKLYLAKIFGLGHMGGITNTDYALKLLDKKDKYPKFEIGTCLINKLKGDILFHAKRYGEALKIYNKINMNELNYDDRNEIYVNMTEINLFHLVDYNLKPSESIDKNLQNKISSVIHKLINSLFDNESTNNQNLIKSNEIMIDNSELNIEVQKLQNIKTSSAYRILGKIYSTYFFNKYDIAKKYYLLAIELDDEIAMYELGQLELTKGNTQSGISLINSAAKLGEKRAIKFILNNSISNDHYDF
jgi:hypothetical protein